VVKEELEMIAEYIKDNKIENPLSFILGYIVGKDLHFKNQVDRIEFLAAISVIINKENSSSG
jgi:hypothetical protein